MVSGRKVLSIAICCADLMTDEYDGGVRLFEEPLIGPGEYHS